MIWREGEKAELICSERFPISRSIKLAENKEGVKHMMKVLLGFFLTGAISILVVLGGCSAQNTPKNTVFRFINATKYSDRAGFEKTMSFERLIIEREGEAYLALPNEKRKEELLKFKLKLLDDLTSGKLKVFGGIDPELREEKITGTEAEVKISDKKNNDMAYIFMLTRDKGAWKIYKIVEAGGMFIAS
jgi:hypothetical protein